MQDCGILEKTRPVPHALRLSLKWYAFTFPVLTVIQSRNRYNRGGTVQDRPHSTALRVKLFMHFTVFTDIRLERAHTNILDNRRSFITRQNLISHSDRVAKYLQTIGVRKEAHRPYCPALSALPLGWKEPSARLWDTR